MTFVVYSLAVAFLLVLAAGIVLAWKAATSPWILLAVIGLLVARFLFLTLGKERKPRVTTAEKKIASNPPKGRIAPKTKTARIRSVARKWLFPRRIANG